MFRRLRLPGKLVLAAVPLALALSGVSFLFVQSAFAQAGEERTAARLASLLTDVAETIDAVADEAAAGGGDAAAHTDDRIADLRSAISVVGIPPLERQLDAADRRLDAVRRAGGDTTGYDQVSGDLLALASLVPAEVADPESARALQGVSAIGRARQIARVQERAIGAAAPLAEADTATRERIHALQLEFNSWSDLFHTVASSEARTIFAQSGAPVATGGVATQVSRLLDGEGEPISEADWQRLLDSRSAALAVFEDRLTETVLESADTAATRAMTEAWVVVGSAVAALLAAGVMTALISRSIVRRVRGITERAQHVAQEQLPALVEALRDPGEDTPLPSIPPIRDRGADEVGDLARSFSAMQSTLEHVAAQQVETLRKGVADMFVTLARRNRSLIDRQLALIDELESDEEDPEALADFYRLDHMATRMRRNAESLLVLAGSEPPRTWRTPLGIDDVVRAAIGEIEDYRRVDVLTLESVRLKGTVVADLSHLLSELLENAAHFSPPQTRVRVSGHFHEEGYLLTVSDRGVGIPTGRLSELNELLEHPPVIGLALEPTLGLYVVAMLAKRHGIGVRLVAGAPGISAKLLVPPALYEQTLEERPYTPPETAARVGRHDATPIEDTPVEAVQPSEDVQESAPPPPVPSPSPMPAPVPASRWAPPSTVEPAQPEPTRSEQPPPGPGALPVRRPGTSFESDPGSERPVSQPLRTADSVRSTFGAFQTGLEAGRRETAREDEE